jgi:DNA-binding NarL/FixJ family response regulator
VSVTTLQIRQITALAQAGTPTAEIARQCAVDPTTVRHYLRIAGVPYPPGTAARPPVTASDIDNAVTSYTAGASLKTISRRLRVDDQIARRLLVDEGVTIRPPGRPRRDGTPPRRRTPTPGEPMPAKRDLTEDELQVLTLACDHDVASIARRLNLGESTVRQRLTRIRGALGARSTAHAIALAFRAGILT